MIDTANRFNQILIIDSIPKGELNTARRLFDDISTYANAYPETSPAVMSVRVESACEFLEVLSECADRANEKDIIPMLHLECHGCEQGFQFADFSILDWQEIKAPLTNLNIATKMNLMVAVAACTGGAIAKTASLSDRAPFWGMIGPTDSISPTDLESAFRALYTTLIQTGLPANALKAFEASSKPGQYWRTTALGLFKNGWAAYKSTYCTEQMLEIRAKRMVEECRRRGLQPLLTVSQKRQRLVAHEPSAYERFRRGFFMEDLFPEQAGRFAVPLQSSGDNG
ncbi:MAG: hypothetical protein OQL19_05315 [Gammaproteobacteria bacterium]|nr:hypothetical protein [Gammaproteobacteria bacterium]